MSWIIAILIIIGVFTTGVNDCEITGNRRRTPSTLTNNTVTVVNNTTSRRGPVTTTGTRHRRTSTLTRNTN